MEKYWAIGVVFCATALSAPAYAADIDLETYGDPATIFLNAEAAEITFEKGVGTLTLRNISTLTSISAAVHEHNERVFTAFPTVELPDAWNSCNVMKSEENLFHNDGFNSLIVFDHGSIEHGHLSSAPLVTATAQITEETGGTEGVLRVMLTDAVYRDEGVMTFAITGDELVASQLTGVQIVTECLIANG